MCVCACVCYTRRKGVNSVSFPSIPFFTLLTLCREKRARGGNDAKGYYVYRKVLYTFSFLFFFHFFTEFIFLASYSRLFVVHRILSRLLLSKDQEDVSLLAFDNVDLKNLFFS